MNNLYRIMLVMVFVSCADRMLAEDNDKAEKRKPEPAYMWVTNNVFAVCYFDPDEKVLYRWKDVSIPRKKLPLAGAMRQVLIFDHGTRPELDTSTANSVDDVPMPPKEFFHIYGPIPYPIKDVDPPMEYFLDAKGNLLIGFGLRGRFYAVKTHKNPALKKTVKKKYWSEVIHVKVPVHRKKTLDDAEKELLNLKLAVESKSETPVCQDD